MSEKLVIVPRKTTGVRKLLNIGLFVAACLLMLMATLLEYLTLHLSSQQMKHVLTSVGND